MNQELSAKSAIVGVFLRRARERLLVQLVSTTPWFLTPHGGKVAISEFSLSGNAFQKDRKQGRKPFTW